jgi:glucose-1-phosphate adenylyltransferase
MNRVLVIIMAGGAGERLQPLTRMRSKGAVPYGGKFRLIDIALSNCVNSELRKIFVLTQYLSESLNLHMQEGWSISSSGLGDFIYSIPAQQKMGNVWYNGTADAVRQNLNLIKPAEYDEVLVLSGDHIYKMNYTECIYYHRMKKASVTVSAIKVAQAEAAGRLGVLDVDTNNKLIGFMEKPAQPKSMPGAPGFVLASMGIYLFNTEFLISALRRKGDDFGKNIIPETINRGENIYVYDFEKENRIVDFKIEVKNGIREKILLERTHDSNYWRDVGTIDSYYDASMDLVGVDPPFSLYGEKWPFRTWQRQLPPSKFILGSRINDSLVSEGCIISGGAIWNSILSPGVIVEKDAVVEQSVIFENVIIEPGVKIKKAIIDKDCRVRTGVSIGYDREQDLSRGFSISPRGIVVVTKGTDITGS